MGSLDSVCVTDSAEAPRTLVALLRSKALLRPERTVYTFLHDGEREEQTLTYGELDRQARAVASRLQEMGLGGERVLLLYGPGLEYIAAFMGCLYAGAVAVPAYPPRNNQSLLRLQMIQADAQAAAALTTSPVKARAELLFDKAPALKTLPWITTDSLEAERAGAWAAPEVDAGSLAFLQYTSGSTSIPKGVMVSHGNLLHNERIIRQVFRQTEDSVIVGWLPFYHDMGLIGNVLQPLYTGSSCVLMSPAAFLQRPLRWLQAVSDYRGTTSGGPNFAYELCVKRITPEQRAALDLSEWRVAFNGAEPIRRDTLERFAAAFAVCGFRREAFYPCYGLAESTLIVSGKVRQGAPLVKAFEAGALEQNRAVECKADGDDARTLVGCGETLHDERVVVDPETLTERPRGQVGEVWVKGASVAQGYWNRPEETEHTFRAHLSDTGAGPYLRTGDLGFLHDGELFITGRAKDLIIIRGLNHYPQDIELTVAHAHPALKPDSGAAFSVEVAGEESLVVVQEVERRHPPEAELESIVDAIRRAVADAHELHVYAVVLIKSRSLPKTSSGKIQRRACRDRFLARTLEEVKSDTLEDTVPSLNQLSLTRETLPASDAAARLRLLEAYVREQTARVLRVDPSRLHTRRSISALGLDSLALIELKNHIESELSVSLPLGSFLQDVSMRQLARQLLEALEAPAPAPLASRHAAAPYAPAPPSYNQESLWFLYQLARESAAYNVGGAARVWGELDADALRRAFQRLIERHLPLRTTFAAVEGKPVPRVDETAELSFTLVDASAWDEAQIEARLFEGVHRPFDLERGPVLRIELFARSPLEHVLLLTVHHIAVDLWSLVVLLDELRVLYPSEKSGAEVSLPPLDFQYPDFAAWQAEMLKGVEGERLWEYWRAQLDGELPVLSLPSDYPRPAVQTYRGASHVSKLNEELTRRLEALAKENGATLYSTLLTAFVTLLHRFTGQEDILVGCPTAGRSRAEFEGLVGNLVNTVVLRVGVSGGATARELMGDVRRTVAAAIEHQQYPLPLLVERLQPTRDAGHSPLFQVMFVLEKPHRLGEQGIAPFVLGETGARMNLGELPLESIAVRRHVAAADLTLLMVKTGDTLSASFEYNTDLFSRETVGRIAGHFRTLIESITADPNRHVRDLVLLTPAEREQVLHEWNPARRDNKRGECLHEMFERQAERAPDATAVVYEETALSYGELNRRSNRLAHRLRSLGVGPETLVALLLERSPEMLVSILAVLKAGGAYVPLDPAYPHERLAFILSDTRAPLLLTRRCLSGLPGEHTARALFVEEEWPEASGLSESNPPRLSGPESLAYVIYTSGSTGRPKGVLISHDNVSQLMAATRPLFDFSGHDCWTLFHSYAFDFSVWEIWGALLYGGRLVVVPYWVGRSAEAFYELLARERVTVLNQTPSAFRQLTRVDEVAAQGDAAAELSLRVVVFGGEALELQSLRGWIDRRGDERPQLVNMYGITETTVHVTYRRVRAADLESAASSVIGRPLPCLEVYLLDERQQPVPVGVAGEICVGGTGLARGYLRRPGLTAERFAPHPFGPEAGARLYRSGDLGRRLADGEIEYVGRADMQVKIRGFRIELGEIEAALARHEDVAEATVVAREGPDGGKSLVAYVVTKGAREASAAGGELSTDGLRSFLKERLPDYMVPSGFVRLDSLPRTANGKLDRKALPAPECPRTEADEAPAAARTPLEEILAGIWSQVLGREEIGVHDNFFELGGHSLLASTVVSKLRHALHVELPLRSFFETPTISELALRIESEIREGPAPETVPLRRVPRDAPLPLSFAQQRLWFLYRLEPESPFYNVPVAFRLYGPLDTPALERCFNEIIRRHEVLRTTFAEVDGQPAQVIAPEAKLRMGLDDLRGVEGVASAREVKRAVKAEARRPFNLETGPLLRARVVRLEEEEHLVVLVVHHIISDGWSMGLMVREVAALYGAYARGEESPLPELPVQYADYAAWQREWLRGEVLDRQLAYWRGQLAGARTVLELPGDRPRPPAQTFRGARFHFSFDAALNERIKEFSRAEGVTLFMSLLAGLSILLGRYSGETDILVGTTIANRSRAEAEDLIGFFVNMLVMRTDLSGNPRVRELLRQVRERALDAYAHQDVPFERVVEELQLGRDLSRAPLTQVVFTLQNAPLDELRLEGLRMNMVEVESETAKFDLVLNMWEERGEMRGWAEYNRDIFDEARVRQMVRHYENVMREMSEKSEERLDGIEMLSAEEGAVLEQPITFEELDTSFSF